MVIGAENLLAIFKQSECPYWRIYTGTQPTNAKQFPISEGKDFANLEAAIAFLAPGRYHLKYTKIESDEGTANWGNGQLCCAFQLGTGNTEMYNQANTLLNPPFPFPNGKHNGAIGNAGGIGEAEVENRIAKAVSSEKEKWTLETRIADMERQLKTKADPMDKVIEVIGQIAPHLFAPTGSGSRATAVAGLPGAVAPSVAPGPGPAAKQDDLEMQLQSALERLEKHCGGTEQLVKKLTTLADKLDVTPSLINMI